MKFHYAGIKGLSLTPKGDLAILLPDGGVVLQNKPLVYQKIEHRRVFREGKFKIHEDTARFLQSFEVATYDRRYPLIIDPVIVYSTYLGGSGHESAGGIAVDREGNTYVTGSTESKNFPVKNQIHNFKGSQGLGDVFVTKINATGTALIYSTYLGGKFDDFANDLAVDRDGNAYLVGTSQSNDFPLKKPLFTRMGAFVTKLNPSGSALVYSTFLGYAETEEASLGIAVDSKGNTYVTGATRDPNFPTKNPLYTYKAIQDPESSIDAFVTKINPAGTSLIYSTYLGGRKIDRGFDIAADQDGNAYVVGQTASADFPTKNPLFKKLQGQTDAFVTKINALGTALVYSTFLGGNKWDTGNCIAIDRIGNVYAGGVTESKNFPTKNPLFHYKGDVDAFVAKINPAGAALVYSSYLGGSDRDYLWGIAADRSGNTYVVGQTTSTDFPIKNPLQTYRGGGDAFVTTINNTGSGLIYSTYLGGKRDDLGNDVKVDREGNAYVTGSTESADFPIKNPIFNFKGRSDVFIAKIKTSGPKKVEAAKSITLTLKVAGQIQRNDAWTNAKSDPNNWHKPMYYIALDANGNPRDGYYDNSRGTWSSIIQFDTKRLRLTWGGPDQNIHTPDDNVSYPTTGWIYEGPTNQWIGTDSAKGLKGRISDDGTSLMVTVPLRMIGDPDTLECSFMASPYTSNHLDLLGNKPGDNGQGGWIVIENAKIKGGYIKKDPKKDLRWPIENPDLRGNFDIIEAKVTLGN